MKVSDYIKGKYADMGISMSDTGILGVIISSNLNPEESVSSDNFRDIEIAFIKSIPEIILRPQSISELGVSISRASTEDIIAYYRSQCRKYSIKDEIEEKRPTIRFIR